VNLICAKKDYRTAVVLDGVMGATFKLLKVSEPGSKKEPVYSYKSAGVVMEKK
jgi:hypothetical protein